MSALIQGLLATALLCGVVAAQEPVTEGREQPKALPPIRPDAHGDALPAGAVARLGTTRLRHHGLCAVAFSPDGKTVASAGSDRKLRLWDAASGCLLREAPVPRGRVRGLLFRGAEPLVCTSVRDGTVTLTAPFGGKQHSAFSGWDELRDVAFSSDARLLATGDAQLLHVWDTATRKEVDSFGVLRSDVQALAMSADGRSVASRHWDILVVWKVGGRSRWEVPAPRDVPHSTHHPGTVAFSPDSKRVAGQVVRDCIHVWDAATGKELLGIEDDHSWGQLLFSPDGRILAVACANSVRLWDASTGKRRGEIKFDTYHIRTFAFSPDGKTLAVGGGDALHLWDLAAGKERIDQPGHANGVSGVAFSPDGKTLASGGKGGVRLWDTGSWKEQRRFHGSERGLTCLVFSQAGDLLSWGGAGHGVRVRLAEANDGLVTLSCGSDAPETISPDGLLRAHWSGGTLWVWEQPQGKMRIRVSPRGGEVVSAAFSPDGKLLAVGTSTGTITLWETAGGRKLRELRARPYVGVGVSFSADGRTLASWDFDGEDDRIERISTVRVRRVETVSRLDPADTNPIRLWEVASGKERARCGGQPEALWSVAFSADGRRVASAGKGGGVRVWDALTGKLLRYLPGHRGEVLSVAFAPDGKTLASGSRDTTVLLWDVSGLQKSQARSALKPGAEDGLWSDLASADAALAYRTIWALAAQPARTVPLLRRHLQPVPVAASPEVERLLANLDHERFAVRDRATAELTKLEEGALPALRQRLKAKLTLESRRRVEQLLARLDFAAPSPEQLRRLRALEVLEHAGTAEAREVLRSLAGGAPEARLTQEARAALARTARHVETKRGGLR